MGVNKNNNYYFSENFKALFSGATAGIIGYTTTLPLDYIKQNLQTNKKIADISRDVRNHGTKILFRGGFIGLTSIAPQMAIKYFSFHQFNNLLDNKTYYKPVAAFGAGLVDGAFLGPVLALQSFKQMTLQNKFCYKTTLRKNIGSLMIPMALRNAIYTSTVLGGYFVIKDNYYSDKKNNFLNNFLLSSILNIPATIFCSPFDVLRAKHNYNLLHHQKEHVDLDIVFRDILKKEGLRGFFRGYFSMYLNFALRFPLTFSLQFEILKLFEYYNKYY